jgi:sec-independent protein translocase protein TatB
VPIDPLTESRVFDLSLEKLVVLALIALFVFGPHELPRIASQAGRALRDLRRIAQGAKEDLREGLGPDFQDFDFDDLNPRRFVRKHLLDDAQPLFNEFKSTSEALTGGTAAAVGNGTRPTLLDGDEPPFDIEAT